MRLIIVIMLALACTPLTPHAARSQDYETLFRGFDAQALSHSEKVFLQAALAFEGHYQGLLDGDWGRLSRNAMQRYSRKEFGTEYEEWHLAFVAFSFFERYERDGWDMRYFPDLGISLLWPEKAVLREQSTEYFQNYRHSTSTLAISIGRHPQATTESLHDYTLGVHEISSKPYTVRKRNLAVSSASRADGFTLYTRSNYVGGAWSNIMVSAESKDAAILNAVTSSISVGRAPKLDLDVGGRLEEAIVKTIALIEQEQDQENTASIGDTSKEDESDAPGLGSGTGFFVSSEGHVLTNAHVVSGCGEISVDGHHAELVSSSEQFDLAILKTNEIDGKAVAVFSAGPAKLNSDVTVIGYPYGGLLSGINVTRGSVSSLKGLAGDAITMQITAPIQSGNSGGPLLGSDGEVVGVVVSKLDALKAVELLGDLPQNVNYAVRGEIAKLYLAQNGIDPVLGYQDDRIDPVDLATSASKFTAFIECQ